MIERRDAERARISAIAVSRRNDDIRLVGTTAGTVFVSTTPAPPQ